MQGTFRDERGGVRYARMSLRRARAEMRTQKPVEDSRGSRMHLSELGRNVKSIQSQVIEHASQLQPLDVAVAIGVVPERPVRRR